MGIGEGDRKGIGEGYPIPVLSGGVPCPGPGQGWRRRVPCSGPGQGSWGVPCPRT